MGVGEPDEMADARAVGALCKEAGKFENRGYADNGCAEFKKAAAEYMATTFSVSLDFNTEILHSIGSKALSILPLCFVNEGDIVITTTPGYPIFGTHARYLGANVIELPLLRTNDYWPDIEGLGEETVKKTKVIMLNYPNNPTGAAATREFFKRVVELAHKHQILLINDTAYAARAFQKSDRVSILEIDGSSEVALEVHCVSKGFNMTGWRIGWVCGSKYLVNAHGSVKDNTDSGQFLPIQKAAIQARADNSIPEANGTRYSRRMDYTIGIMNGCGFKFSKPKAGFFFCPARASRG
jgi:LL-diaminopimelate aminotransferase